MRALTFVGLLVLAGCPDRASSPPPSAPPDPAPAPDPSPPAPATPPSTAALVDPLPTGGAVSPTRIEVVNTTGHEVQMAATFGDVEPVGVARIEGALGPITLDRPDSPDARVACDCPCDDHARCPDCEAPMPRQVPVVAGATRTIAWNGKLRRRRIDGDGDDCFDAFAAPPGRYVFRACTVDRACGHAEVTLPAESVRIELGSDATRASCPLPPELLTRAARAALHQVWRQPGLRDRIASCTPSATCVAEGDLEARERTARGCAVFVIPGGDALRAEVFAPLPSGTNGGERFMHWLDPDATGVQRVRYEQ